MVFICSNQSNLKQMQISEIIFSNFHFILTLSQLTSGLFLIDWEGRVIATPPPFISFLWYNISLLIDFLRALGFYLNNLKKKMQIFKNPNLCKVFCEIWQIYILKRPWPSKLKYTIIFANFSRKTENVQISSLHFFAHIL